MLGLPADYYPIELAIELVSDEKLPRLYELIAGRNVRFEKLIHLPSGMLCFRSDGDLSVMTNLLKLEFGDNISIGYPSIAYRERMTRAIEIEHAQAHPEGPTQPFTHIKLRFLPTESGSGFVFESALPDDAASADLLAGVERGLVRAKEAGLRSGYPVTDFRATLVSFDFGGAEPSSRALEAAARAAFQELITASEPRILVPCVDLTISLEGEPAEIVRRLLAERVAVEMTSDDAGQLEELRFHARLDKVLGLAAELRHAAPRAHITATRYAGMKDMP